jgi:hypothetical protein
MKETIKSIIDWHEQTFPDATLEGQLEKFKDEEKEYEEADEKDVLAKSTLMELADLVIVACGIARFDLLEGLYAFESALHWINKCSCFEVDDVASAVQEKMKINRNRKWSIGKGNYQHIEENK